MPFYAPSPPSHSASRPISPSPSPTPIGGETLINPNPHGGQKTALGKVYVPRIYGFKVSERARNGPRMKWLRERPERWEELDTVDWKGRFKGDADTSASVSVSVSGDDSPAKEGRASKGKLFDDDDEGPEEEDDEEEEEDVGKPTTTTMTTGHSLKSTPTPAVAR